MKRIERTRQVEHVDSEGSWAISYGDMITLLMSFFVLYFTVDHSKVRANQMQQSLMVHLQDGGVKADQEGLKRQVNLGKEVGDGVDPTILQQMGAKLHPSDRGLMVEFQDISFFKVGKVEVNSDGQRALENFAKIYMPFAGNYQLSVQAFTDTRKVRDDNPRYKDNLELSALRSVASMRVLQKAGIPLNRIKISGYGELIETQERLMKLNQHTDPLKFTRKVVLMIEPAKERN